MIILLTSIWNFIKIINVINQNRNYYRDIESFLISENTENYEEKDDKQTCIICKKKLLTYRKLKLCSHKVHL